MDCPILPGWTLKRPRPPKKKKIGRPRKRKIPKKRGAKRKKRKFEETTIGFLILHEAPLEYALIQETLNGNVPDPDFIEEIGYASLNPLFKKNKFRRALKLYRETGLYSGVPKKTTPKTELYYIRLRQKLIVG